MNTKNPIPLHDGGDECFDPSTVEMLEQVVEAAVQELATRGSPLAEPGRAELTRELMAHRVMSRALRGERDPARLKEHALWGFLD